MSAGKGVLIMGAEIPVAEFADHSLGSRLTAQQARPFDAVFVEPAESVMGGLFDVFDRYGRYRTTLDSGELSAKQEAGHDVFWRGSGAVWRPERERKRGARKGHGTRRNRPAGRVRRR